MTLYCGIANCIFGNSFIFVLEADGMAAYRYRNFCDGLAAYRYRNNIKSVYWSRKLLSRYMYY